MTHLVPGHTDIRAGGWVGRLPAPWRPYALLMRLDRPIGAWLLVLPGLWGIALALPLMAVAKVLLAQLYIEDTLHEEAEG